MERLVADGYDVLLETGGHRPLDEVPDEVACIVDVKCPASGEAGKMHWPNLEMLSSRDEVKFVIADRPDFEYALDVARRFQLDERAGAVLFSPAFGILEPALLAEWLIDARLPARLQLQTHKYIWDPRTRGV
jgi:7-carboxy-7-deazaguanine synthase